MHAYTLMCRFESYQEAKLTLMRPLKKSALCKISYL